MNRCEIRAEMFKLEHVQKLVTGIAGEIQSLFLKLQVEKPFLLKGKAEPSRDGRFCLQILKGANNEAEEKV